MQKLVYLTTADVKKLLDAGDVVRLAEDTLRAHAAGQITWSTPRMLGLRSEKMTAHFGVKLCHVEPVNAVGFRLTTVVRGQEREDGPPTRLVLLSDPDTGAFFAIVDERWSYAVRTGAGAAIALKHLAPGATEVGLVGAGLMARGTAHALKAALPLRKLLVTSRRPETRAAFAAEVAAELGIEVEAVDTAAEVMARTLAVVAATTAPSPFIETAWLRPGCTVYSMGAKQELETSAYLELDKFVVDDWEQVALKEDMKHLLGTGVFDPKRVHADLAQIVTGARPGRESAGERIMIRSQGLVTMDVTVSHYLYHKALARGLGQEVAL